MLRIKKRSSGVYALTASAIDDDGAAQTVTSPSITVKDGAGVTVATGTPTVNGTTLSYSLAASALAYLDTYTITWSGTIGGNPWSWDDTLELVGGYLFEIADLRTFDRAFTDATKYPTATLRDVRTAVEQVIEGDRAAQLAFVPRGARVAVNGTTPDLRLAYNPLTFGNDYRSLVLPNFAVRTIHSCSINGTVLTQDELDALTIDDNVLWRPAGVTWPAWPYGHRNIVLHYEHGLSSVPGPIRRAALILAREYLVTSPLPGRATATSIGDQLFRLTIAGRDGVTGLPEVDAAIDQHGRKGFGIG